MIRPPEWASLLWVYAHWHELLQMALAAGRAALPHMALALISYLTVRVLGLTYRVRELRDDAIFLGRRLHHNSGLEGAWEAPASDYELGREVRKLESRVSLRQYYVGKLAAGGELLPAETEWMGTSQSERDYEERRRTYPWVDVGDFFAGNFFAEGEPGEGSAGTRTPRPATKNGN